MNPEKNLFTKFIQVYTSNFLRTRFATEERGSRLRHISTSSAILLMEVCEPA